MSSSFAEHNNRINQQQPCNRLNHPEVRVHRLDDDVRCLCLERIISVCILCMLALFFVWLVLVIVLVFEGNPEFKTSSTLVSPFKISNSQISTNWTIGLLVTNTNYLSSTIYDGFDVLVYLDNGQYLCETTYPAFEQGSREQTSVIIIGPKACAQVLTGAAAENINGGVAYFEIRIRVRYRHAMDKHMSWIWPGKNWKKSNVRCKNVEVWFPSNGTQGRMVGKMKQCRP